MKRLIFIPLLTFFITACMEQPANEAQIFLGKICRGQQSYGASTYKIGAYYKHNFADTIEVGTIEYEQDQHEGHIDTINVDSKFKKIGIGSALFLKAMDHLYNMGATSVTWKAVDSISFYTRFGARIEGVVEDETAKMIFKFDKDGNPRENYFNYQKSKQQTGMK